MYVHTPASQSAPQANQCEMLHFLASVGACNLILHIYVVVNWQLSKEGFRLPVLQYTVSWAQLSTHQGYVIFFKFTADKRS